MDRLSKLMLKFEFFYLFTSSSQRVRRRESKTDSYSKDLLFLAYVAFCVITFEPIMIQTCSAPQNDRLIFSFVKDIKVGVEKMTPSWSKNGLLSAASFVFRNHRAEFATLYLLLCGHRIFKLLYDKIYQLKTTLAHQAVQPPQGCYHKGNLIAPSLDGTTCQS